MEAVKRVGVFGFTKVVPTAVLIFLLAVLKNLVRGRKETKKQLRFNGERPALGKVIGKVSEVNVFPGKSMAACSLERCKVTSAGLHGDRLIMVVSKTMVVATQRSIPQLSQIVAKVSQNLVTLSLPELPPLNLNLSIVDRTSDAVTIDLHTIKAPCVDLGDAAAEWINGALTKLCGKTKSGYRVFTLTKEENRKVYNSPARLLMENARSFDATLLSDLAPITFTSEASLLALNEAATKPVPMDRFRTNIVASIDRELAFLEDHVKVIQVGSQTFHAIGPTFRCVIPSVDQATSEAGFRKNIRKAEPIATLKRLRSGGLRFGLSGLLPTSAGGSKSLAPLFGIYLGCERDDSSGEVSIGDPIRVVEYKSNLGFVTQVIDAIATTLGLDRAA
mmetsp:Transcript_24043/g.44604  ORF Transcript_24043/g.44604 Transcript_24043/m.44604 type:complete len:390 (+) Transcript_24043:47-1216(+)